MIAGRGVADFAHLLRTGGGGLGCFGFDECG